MGGGWWHDARSGVFVSTPSCMCCLRWIADVPGSVETPAAAIGASGEVMSAKRRTWPALWKVGRTARVSCAHRTRASTSCAEYDVAESARQPRAGAESGWRLKDRPCWRTSLVGSGEVTISDRSRGAVTEALDNNGTIVISWQQQRQRPVSRAAAHRQSQQQQHQRLYADRGWFVLLSVHFRYNKRCCVLPRPFSHRLPVLS